MERMYDFSRVPLTVSNPILYQFSQTANLVGGHYEWVGTKAALSPDRSVLPSAMYWFRTVTVSADVAPEDYTAAIVTAPSFSLFLKQDAGALFFTDPIRLAQFMQNAPCEFARDPEADPNGFLGAITGKLKQIDALWGKTSITIFVTLTAQEIGDDKFNASLKKGYCQ